MQLIEKFNQNKLAYLLDNRGDFTLGTSQETAAILKTTVFFDKRRRLFGIFGIPLYNGNGTLVCSSIHLFSTYWHKKKFLKKKIKNFMFFGSIKRETPLHRIPRIPRLTPDWILQVLLSFWRYEHRNNWTLQTKMIKYFEKKFVYFFFGVTAA